MGLEHLRQVERAGRVLQPGRTHGRFEHGRLVAQHPLETIVLHTWWVRWGPQGDVFQQRVLSDPVIHVTFETGSGPMHGFPMPAALVHGVVPEVFEVTLPSEGRVTGVAFQPGAFATMFGVDASSLTGRVVPAEDIMGEGVKELRDALVAEPDERVRQEILIEHMILKRSPAIVEDPAYRMVRQACELVDREDFARVEELADAVHVSPRTLQRLFPRLVGVPPLWVIRRRRLQRVVERLDRGGTCNLAELATELGFADQAHLTREFRRVIGRPPGGYRDRS